MFVMDVDLAWSGVQATIDEATAIDVDTAARIRVFDPYAVQQNTQHPNLGDRCILVTYRTGVGRGFYAVVLVMEWHYYELRVHLNTLQQHSSILVLRAAARVLTRLKHVPGA